MMGLTKLTAGILLYTLVVTGAIIGANTGYAAETNAEATIAYHGDHAVVGTERVDTSYDPDDAERADRRGAGPFDDELSQVAESDSNQGFLEPQVHAFTASLLDTSFALAFGVAGAVSVFVYQNQWIPMVLVEGVLTAASVVPVLVMGIAVLRQVRNAAERGVI